MQEKFCQPFLRKNVNFQNYKEAPPAVLYRLKQLSIEVMEEEAKKDPQFKRVYEAYKTFKVGHYEYQWIQILDEVVRKDGS
ncbi:MAG: hypothetical protein JSV88_10255 [Candidatus Aminicenantes bacterium]|nr:MAG: hypothetical protein JSV88_10255 [Candidatus Aminicenantes bacterium]